jgi:hypothetical protein
MTNNTWTKKALAALVLVLLIPGQAVRAEESTTNFSPIYATTEAEVTVTMPPTVQDVLLAVCENRGYGQECAQILLGMLWNESSNISTAVGDHGKARGYFQIHYKLHRVTTDCAEDLVCSADWSISYLERNGYPTYVTWAVQCHNGCGARNGYAANAFWNGATFWNQPLIVTQAAPIVLPTAEETMQVVTTITF